MRFLSTPLHGSQGYRFAYASHPCTATSGYIHLEGQHAETNMRIEPSPYKLGASVGHKLTFGFGKTQGRLRF